MAVAAALALGALAPGGCALFENAQPNPKSDSIMDLWAPPTPMDAVTWATDPYDADKRLRGILLLSNAPFGGERPYVEMYRLAARDGDPAVRAAAIGGLALHGSPEDAPLLAERLEDEAPNVRREAARALQRLHNPIAVTPLIRRLDAMVEPDIDTRAKAANALGQYAEMRVVQALIGALSDHRLTVNENALLSLKVLTGENFGYAPRAWVDWANTTSHPFASRGVYEYPVFHRDPTIVEYILPWSSPPNEETATPVGMPRTASVQRPAPEDEQGGEGSSSRAESGS